MSLPTHTHNEMYTNTKRNKANVLNCYGLENLFKVFTGILKYSNIFKICLEN